MTKKFNVLEQQKEYEDNKKVTVCDKCFQASCWRGLFMCEESRNAGTVDLTITELRKLNTGEHYSYWEDDE